MFLQRNFYPTSFVYSFSFSFLHFFLLYLFSLPLFKNKKKTKKKPTYTTPNHTINPSLALVSWGCLECIEGNSFFRVGGGHTLVGANYAHVTACKNFDFRLLWVWYLTCEVCSRVTLLHSISSHCTYTITGMHKPFFHIWDHMTPILFYSPELILIGITLIYSLHKSLISASSSFFFFLLDIASACALF